MTGQLVEHEESLEFIAATDAPIKLVIAGNHDLSLHEDYWLSNPKAKTFARVFSQDGSWDANVARQARNLWTGQHAKTSGIKYLEEGMHAVRLANGAEISVYASQWQPEFGDWAFK